MNTQVHTDPTDRGGPMDWTWTYDSTSSPVKWPHDSTDKSPFIPVKPDDHPNPFDGIYQKYVKDMREGEKGARIKELEDEVAQLGALIKQLRQELDNYRRILSE